MFQLVIARAHIIPFMFFRSTAEREAGSGEVARGVAAIVPPEKTFRCLPKMGLNFRQDIVINIRSLPPNVVRHGKGSVKFKKKFSSFRENNFSSSKSSDVRERVYFGSCHLKGWRLISAPRHRDISHWRRNVHRAYTISLCISQRFFAAGLEKYWPSAKVEMLFCLKWNGFCLSYTWVATPKLYDVYVYIYIHWSETILHSAGRESIKFSPVLRRTFLFFYIWIIITTGVFISKNWIQESQIPAAWTLHKYDFI